MASDNKALSLEQVLQNTLEQLEFNTVLDKIAQKSVSQLGKELINNSKPEDDLEYLQNEHQYIEEMTEILTQDDELPISGLSDVRLNLEKCLVENALINASSILDILDNLRVIRRVKYYFLSRTESYDNLKHLVSNLFEDKLLEKHITEAIKDDGSILDNATRELLNIRTSIHEKSQRLRSKLRKILRRVVEEDIVQDDFYSIKEGRFVLPVKTENKRTLPGIIHGVSNTGATVFIEPSEIIDLNNELSLLHNQEEREIEKILKTLTSEIGSSYYEIIASLEIMGHIDAILSKAKYALDYGGIKPVISEENNLILRKVKHPILVQSKGKDNVIPLNIEFNQDKRGHLISGPNAGGKTVALKSIGLNIAMALSGIFPIGECKTNFRYIFSSIGDHQSIENDLSTFSSQIYQIKNILENCDNQSLVLIDEIGSGTDPQEGAALASGILDTFININLFFVATTHQSSLKTYALNRKEIENASLEFNEEKLIPTYNFLSGTPGNSYAFFLAGNVGLSKLVIKRAKKYLGKKQKELESSISILSKYRAEAVEKRVEYEKEKIKHFELKRKYEDKLAGLTEKRKEMIEDAQKEAADIVKDANSLIENTIKEIREIDKEKSFSKIKKEYIQKKKDIEKRAEKLDKKEEVPVQTEEIKFGDLVRMIDSNSEGSVLSIDDDGKSALVEFNGLKFKTPVKKLIKIEKKNENKDKKQKSDYISFEASSRIDIRGLRADEAIDKTGAFISDAILSNLEFATIVHGKGTGALREAIHQYLKHHQSVESFRLGELTEGGAGVTIVYFS